MRLSVVLASLPLLASALYENGSVTAPCDSPLYCQGEILRAIQLAAPFDDSKTFVDLYVAELWMVADILAKDSIAQPLVRSTRS